MKCGVNFRKYSCDVDLFLVDFWIGIEDHFFSAVPTRESVKSCFHQDQNGVEVNRKNMHAFV